MTDTPTGIAADNCRDLHERIKKLEASLDDYYTGERVASVGTGAEQTSYFAGTQIPQGIRQRISDLKAQYDGQNCAVILGTPAPTSQQPRRSLRFRAGPA